MKSFTTQTFIPQFISVGTSTEVSQPRKLSQQDLSDQALKELCVMVSCAYQTHTTGTSGQTKTDFHAIAKYFLRKYFVRLTPHLEDDHLIKVKYTVANFEWLWQLAARGVVLKVDRQTFEVTPVMYAPMKTFNVGEYPRVYGGEVDLSTKKSVIRRADIKYDGSLIVMTSGHNPRLPEALQSEQLMVTTSGSWANGKISNDCSDSWSQVVIKAVNASDNRVQAWMDAHPEVTINFELCTPHNIIVSVYDFGEYPSRLYLLGAFDEHGRPLSADLMAELKNIWENDNRLLASSFVFGGLEGLDALMTEIANDPRMADCKSRPEGVALYDRDGVFVAKYKFDDYFADHRLRSDDPGSERDLINLSILWLEDVIDDIIPTLIPCQLKYVDEMKTWFERALEDFNVIPYFMIMPESDDPADLRRWVLKLYREKKLEIPVARIPVNFHAKIWCMGHQLDTILNLIAEKLDMGVDELLVDTRETRANFARCVQEFDKDFHRPLYYSIGKNFRSGHELAAHYLYNTGKPSSKPTASPAASSSSTASSSKPKKVDEPSRSFAMVFDYDATLNNNQELFETSDLGHRDPDTLFGEWVENVCGMLVSSIKLGMKVYVVTGRNLDLRPNLIAGLEKRFPAVLDLTVIMKPPYVQGLKTSEYKMAVYGMLKFHHRQILVVDDDVKVHRKISELGAPSLQVLNGSLFPPPGMRTSNSTTVVAMVGPPGMGKSSILNSVYDRLSARGDSVTIISTDKMDRRVVNDVKPLPMMVTIDGRAHMVAIEDPDYEPIQGVRAHFSVLEILLRSATSSKWIIVDSCNAQMSSIKTLESSTTDLRLFTLTPIEKTQKGKRINLSVPGAFLGWCYHNILSRSHDNLDSTKVDPSRIWTILTRKATSAANILGSTSVPEVVSLTGSDLSYPTKLKIGGKDRTLSSYMNNFIKTLIKAGELAKIGEIAAEVSIPPVEVLVERMMTSLDSSPSASSSGESLTFRDIKYRAIAINPNDIPDRRDCFNHAIYPHVTLAMGGDEHAYECAELLGKSFEIHVTGLHEAKFEDGSWVQYYTVSVDHPLVSDPSLAHITLQYHDVHSSQGGAYMAHRALAGESLSHEQLDTTPFTVVGYDAFLPSGLNC